MQKIEIELDDVELAQLEAFSRLNNSSKENMAALLISNKLAEAIDKGLEDVLFEPSKPKGRYS